MRRVRFALGIAITSFVFTLPALAQYELITIERPFRAQSLAGVVVDSTGAPVAGVAVEDRDASFKSVLHSTTTDANGRFAFSQVRNGTTHYLHLESRGFDPMQIAVKLRRLARAEVRIQLHVAS